jgi:hypothetical protein
MPKSPHILLAAANCQRVKSNLSYILNATAMAAIDAEIEKNVKGLFRLGLEHHAFASALPLPNWRQRISRDYYGAYNVARAVRLANDGSYSTDVGDHKKATELPDAFPNQSTHSNRLGVLRDDRNLADYDHTAAASDLVTPVPDAAQFVDDFIRDARTYLSGKGIAV